MLINLLFVPMFDTIDAWSCLAPRSRNWPRSWSFAATDRPLAGRGLHARRRALPERFPGARGLQLAHGLAALQLPPDRQGRLRPDQRRRAPGQDAAQRGLPARRLDRLEPPGGDGADGGGGGQEVL